MAQVVRYRSGALRIADEYEFYAKEGSCFLPHSCGPWVVGDKEDAKALIADLQAFVSGKYHPVDEIMPQYDDDDG